MDLRDVIDKAQTYVDSAFVALEDGNSATAEQELILAETLIRVEVRGINAVPEVSEAKEEGTPEESKSKTLGQDEAAGKS